MNPTRRLNLIEAGDGPPLLMLHSYLGGSGAWVLSFAHFGRRYRCLALDLPGYAGSHAVPTANTIEDYAESVIEMADALECRCFRLIGHSMGGNVALQVALTHPERVERLVLYGSVCRGHFPGRFETVAETVERLKREGIGPTRDRIVPAWFKDGTTHPLYAFCHAAGVGVTAETAIAYMTQVAAWDVSAQLPHLTVPTLLIGGDRDGAIPPALLFEQASLIPSSSLAIVPGCGHAVHLEAADLFHRIVGDFLS